ncbi:HAD family hydrolase [Chitinibacteraceae bacterium HSL-7]
MSTPSRPAIQAVVFDAFGTLLAMGHGHRPYLQLMRALRASGRAPRPDDARTVLTFNGPPEALAAHLGYRLTPEEQASIEHALAADLAQIALYDDVKPALAWLNASGIRLALCSNLAQPYGAAVDQWLPALDAYALSFQLGCIKPEPAIYAHVLEALQLPASACLFVGDTPAADVTGPQAAGMAALQICRQGGPALMVQLKAALRRSDAVRS